MQIERLLVPFSAVPERAFGADPGLPGIDRSQFWRSGRDTWRNGVCAIRCLVHGNPEFDAELKNMALVSAASLADDEALTLANIKSNGEVQFAQLGRALIERLGRSVGRPR